MKKKRKKAIDDDGDTSKLLVIIYFSTDAINQREKNFQNESDGIHF